jgi:putative flippase GtrA
MAIRFLNGIKNIFFWIDGFLYKLPIIGSRLYLRQMVKFIISGGLMTVVDFAVYIFLTRTFIFWREYYFWANLVSMSVGAVGSFILNKKWAFKNTANKGLSQGFKFWLFCGLGGMIIYQFLLVLFVETFSIYDLLSKALAAIIVLFVRFAIQKFWIFK